VNATSTTRRRRTRCSGFAAGRRGDRLRRRRHDDGLRARFVGAALEGFGGLDIIVNTPATPGTTLIQKMTDDQWYAMLDVHATAPFRICARRRADPQLAKKEKTRAGRCSARS